MLLSSSGQETRFSTVEREFNSPKQRHYGPIAQLDRARVYETQDRGSSPRRISIYLAVAQSGRALTSGVRGRRIEACQLDHFAGTQGVRPALISCECSDLCYKEIMAQTKEQELKYQRNYYASKGDVYRKKIQEGNKRVLQALKQTIIDAKIGKSCSCGESHIACLDFHHREGEVKLSGISEIPTKGWSQKRLKSEIAKCDIICSNCHRKLHYEERSAPLV